MIQHKYMDRQTDRQRHADTCSMTHPSTDMLSAGNFSEIPDRDVLVSGKYGPYHEASECWVTFHSERHWNDSNNNIYYYYYYYYYYYHLSFFNSLKWISRDSRKSRQKMAKKHGTLLWKSQKITAVYIAPNSLKLMVSNCRKIYKIGKIHTTMTSHIPRVSNKEQSSKGKGKVK